MIELAKHQSLEGRKILIVDDSKEITSLLADTFATVGSQTIEINNGFDAMILITTGDFDILILDIIMPQPDGWSILQFMRSRQDWLKRTIVLTANRYDRNIIKAAFDLGVSYMCKPFILSDILDMASGLTDQTTNQAVA